MLGVRAVVIRRFLLWVGVLLLADQVTKAIVRATLVEGQTRALWPGKVEFTLVYNEGIAFGLFPGVGIYLAPLAVIVAIVGGFAFVRARSQDRLFRAGMVLISAGALGNFVDRVFLRGKVTDFIDLKFIHVFNIADACITTAAALLFVHWMVEAGKVTREPEPGKEQGDETAT